MTEAAIYAGRGGDGICHLRRNRARESGDADQQRWYRLLVICANKYAEKF